MKPHQLLTAVGIALVATAFVKFAFLGYLPEEGAVFAGIAVLGAASIALADVAKGRRDGWQRRPDVTAT